ncbi:MAG: type III-B CRISPR module RAMP protein Cmr6 [Campylobacterales bacterium]|nr:type III-B CRISPR module RAMP protein Cmr6 [Campylobacterales bacterium]
MSKANLGWLYYKEMYRNGNDDGHIQKTFKRLLEVSAKDTSLNKEHAFELKTTYPGLIIGSGYTHGISNNFDTKMGFYFDFTTGIPTIAGSSIKGVLRSLFGHGKNDNYQNEKHEYIRALLGKESLDVALLAEEIFEGKKDEKPIGIYKRDKFYEARITDTAGGILQEDYITPHKEALKNPVPIKIVKIRANTTFEFSFELHDTNINGISVTADEKLILFFELLQFHGLGAKTNVGYGQFQEVSVEQFISKRKLKQEALKEQLLKEQQLQEDLKKKKELKDALSQADTNVKKIELIIKGTNDNKEIFDLIESYELSSEEKSELLNIIKAKLGPKPEESKANLKKATTKWAIKIYNSLES